MAFPRRAECRLPMFWFSSFKKIFPVIWRSGPHKKKKHYVCFFNWIVLKTEEKWTVGTRMSLKKIAYAEK